MQLGAMSSTLQRLTVCDGRGHQSHQIMGIPFS